MEILTRLSQFPPPLVRLMATERRRWKTRSLSDEEIAERSGLSVERVRAIKLSKSWETIPVGELVAFMHGCGFNVFEHKDRNRVTSYLRSRGGEPLYAFARAAPHWRTQLQEILKGPTGMVVAEAILELGRS